MLKNFINCLPKKSFCAQIKVSLFPDQILDKLKFILTSREESESKWLEIESNLMDNINFFDSDQFVDTVCLIAHSNKGTEALWDVLSRKIFDYELDLAQNYSLGEALKNCNKHEAFMADPIARNNLVWDLKWPQESKVFIEKLL